MGAAGALTGSLPRLSAGDGTGGTNARHPALESGVSDTLFTIGHSNRPLEAVVKLLKDSGVGMLVDIRRFPGSRTVPHFNRGILEARLPEAGIAYRWLEALGGRRRTPKASPSINTGLRNASFRSYADYMATPEFQEGIEELLRIARSDPTAIMCAEAVYWRCHRRLVSDWLTAHGWQVLHIQDRGEPKAHVITPGAVLTASGVTYPSPADQTPLFDSINSS